MNAQGERFLARLEQLFGQLRESVDDLEAQPLRTCNDEMIATLQQVSLSYRFVYEAAYMDAMTICSNRGDERAFDPCRRPDIKGPTYSYWLNTTTEPDENRAALMLGRGNFRGRHLSRAFDRHGRPVARQQPGGGARPRHPGNSGTGSHRRSGRRPRPWTASRKAAAASDATA